jgi:hypothetical protein
MKKMMVSIQVYRLCNLYHYGKRNLQRRNQRMELTILPQYSYNSPLTWTPHLNGRLLIYKREESGVKHD